jgi:hypothetical protein
MLTGQPKAPSGLQISNTLGLRFRQRQTRCPFMNLDLTAAAFALATAIRSNGKPCRN